VAEPLTLSLWSEESVKVGDVLDALEALRKPEPMPPTRTSVMTLVVVATDPASAERANAAIHELGGRHPARLLTLLCEPDGRGIDAEVRLLGGEAEGHDLWFEDVRLVVRGEAGYHLDSLIEPFTLPDLPVVVWFVDDLPAVGDPLLMAADVLLVDARELGDADCFDTLVALAATRPIVDLSWVRLRPWRELLAGLFEGPDFRPFVGHVRLAEVIGKTGPRHLLGGWVGDRLQLGAGAVHLEPAKHVTIRLFADDGAGRAATFEVVRQDDERVVRARADVEHGPSAEAILQLPESTPAWGLADALAHLEHDPVYEAALRRATTA
jgi:glucose-6-phosphate dehydrogenase assembly protein OpcA